MKIKITIPTELKDISLSQYQKFVKTTTDSKDFVWINNQTVGIFCNISDEQVRGMSKKDYNSILKSLADILKQDGMFRSIIKHNGKEYGFIPCLDEITVGEQADIDSMINDWDKMDKVMAILYRPITIKRKGKYLIEEYTGNEKPLDVNMEVVNGALVFFYNLFQDLLIYTQSCIQEAAHRPEVLQILEKNGIGIKIFIQSQKEIFSSLIMSLNLNSMRR